MTRNRRKPFTTYFEPAEFASIKEEADSSGLSDSELLQQEHEIAAVIKRAL